MVNYYEWCIKIHVTDGILIKTPGKKTGPRRETGIFKRIVLLQSHVLPDTGRNV